MSDISAVAALLGAILAPLASIVVVILQIRAGKKQSKADSDRRMEEEHRRTIMQEEGKKIDNLTSNLDKLTNAVNDIADKQDATDRTVKALTVQMKSTTNILLNHQRATAEVLTTMAEGFRDNKLNGNVTAAIEKYNTVENAMLQDALKDASDLTNK